MYGQHNNNSDSKAQVSINARVKDAGVVAFRCYYRRTHAHTPVKKDYTTPQHTVYDFSGTPVIESQLFSLRFQLKQELMCKNLPAIFYQAPHSLEGFAEPPSTSSISRLIRGSSEDGRKDYSIHGLLGDLKRFICKGQQLNAWACEELEQRIRSINLKPQFGTDNLPTSFLALLLEASVQFFDNIWLSVLRGVKFSRPQSAISSMSNLIY
uniref:Uncharacterized protein n=1 Tax=Glossina pallidipes TaxID=7398 RepID=A0A1A9Z5C6_GLOPL